MGWRAGQMSKQRGKFSKTVGDALTERKNIGILEDFNPTGKFSMKPFETND